MNRNYLDDNGKIPVHIGECVTCGTAMWQLCFESTMVGSACEMRTAAIILLCRVDEIR